MYYSSKLPQQEISIRNQSGRNQNASLRGDEITNSHRLKLGVSLINQDKWIVGGFWANSW